MSKNTPAPVQSDDQNDYNVTYAHFIKPLYKDVENARKTNKDPLLIDLAASLIECAKTLDFKNVSASLTAPYNGHVVRDFLNPTTYSNEWLKGQEWADKSGSPLHGAEKWNTGRRKTSSGIAYALDKDNTPINPYFNYGIKDRGMIGRYGPNHAVDCGALRIKEGKDGKPTLCALGIIRNDNHRPALCGGFIEFEEYGNGHYSFGKDNIVRTQANEFFEEMISGSVELLPEYAHSVQNRISEAFQNREDVLKHALSSKEKAMIAAQITTHAKVEQVKKEDPLFMSSLRGAFRNAHECYMGPVLSSSRNTNTSWMETQLSWFMLDEKKWDQIKGHNKFNYDFKAGDDAQEVLWHEIKPDLIESSEGHAALFCFLMSSYLLNEDHKDTRVLKAIKDQAVELVDFITKECQKTSKPEAACRPI